MAHERINRDGVKTIASTLYVTKATHRKYENASYDPKKKKSNHSKLMTETLEKHAPKEAW